jgi:hypothetical protein
VEVLKWPCSTAVRLSRPRQGMEGGKRLSSLRTPCPALHNGATYWYLASLLEKFGNLIRRRVDEDNRFEGVGDR